LQRLLTYRFLLLIFVLLPFVTKGQEQNYDSLLQRIDTIENPVYMPVVSFAYGVLNFRGDVQNIYMSPVSGHPGYSINVSTFVDKTHFFVANFSILSGKLSGNSYSYGDVTQNLNFQTSLTMIGVNLEYRFGHLVPAESLIRPYVSLGVGSLQFSSKGDLEDGAGNTYHYWSDGSIMNEAESVAGTALPLSRDYLFETDLRNREQELGFGDYGQSSLTIPLGIGGQFRINNRAFFSLGFTYHYTFTDMLDNVAQSGTSISGSKGNDSFIFSNVALHFDLFSDPATRSVDLLYADVEFDPLLFDDEDGDFVLDVTDRCPGTPYGVEVDTLGCPLDGDFDDVPDYLDQENETALNAWVDEQGVTVSEEDYLAAMEVRNSAMTREDVAEYLAIISGEYQLRSSHKIPEKFKSLDVDGDGYLSFDELLLVIDQYFDFQLDLNVEEIRLLNDFFFAQ
jgi:hypothetical protein